MDQNQIIQIIKENDNLGYEEIKKQALQSGIDEITFNEAWKIAKSTKQKAFINKNKNTFIKTLINGNNFGFIALALYSLTFSSFLLDSHDLISTIFYYTRAKISLVIVTILLIISLIKDKKKLMTIIFLIFLALVFYSYIIKLFIVLMGPYDRSEVYIESGSGLLIFIPIIYFILYVAIKGIFYAHLKYPINNAINNSAILIKIAIYLFIGNALVSLIGITLLFTTYNGTDYMVIALLINVIVMLIDLLLSAYIKGQYNEMGGLIIGNFLAIPVYFGMFILLLGASIGP